MVLLNISFFIAAFTSVFWLIFCFDFLKASGFTESGGLVLLQGVSLCAFPLAVIWGIFAVIKGYYNQKKMFEILYNLSEQAKKNAEAALAVSQTACNLETDLKNSFMLEQFDMLISDINEILSDIIKRSNSVSSGQLEHLWSRAAGGEKWLIAKTFVEIIDFQSGFSEHLLQKAQKNDILRGSILEFCSRYKDICGLLQIFDVKKVFSNVVENGVLGKVFQILTPIEEKLLFSTNKREQLLEHRSQSSDFNGSDFALSQETISFPSFLSEKDHDEKIQKNEEDFGYLQNREQKVEEDNVPTLGQVTTDFSRTQSVLKQMKRQQGFLSDRKNSFKERKTPVISLEELEEEINATPENNYNEYAYPFGKVFDDKKNK